MRRITLSIIILFLLFSNQIPAQERKDIVLLKNHGGILPLEYSDTLSIAMIGPGHREVADLLGDSVFIYSSRGVNILNDVMTLDTNMVYIGQGVTGFSAKYYNNLKASGTPAKFSTDKYIDFYWGNEIPFPELDSTAFSVKWDATLIPAHGPAKVKIIHNGGCRLFLDGRLIIDAWEKGPARIDSGWLNIEKGKSYNIQLDYFSTGGPAIIKLGFEYLKDFLMRDAIEKALKADYAVIFVKQPLLFNSPGEIRASYEIPCQSELIRAVYEVNPNTIVILQSGGAVDIESWAFDIPAILLAWEPGAGNQEAVAEALFGQLNPYGKLPFRWTMNWNQNYDTRFPQGFGMTYTIFGIGKLLMKRESDNSGWLATVEIRNLGSRAGTEKLQLFLRYMQEDIPGLKGLKASKDVTLFPGMKKTVGINIPYSAFEVADEEGKPVIFPGKYEVMVGTSEENIKLRKRIEIKKIHIDQYYKNE